VIEPWRPRAEVVEVVDGDTFHSNLDIGWGIVLKPRRMPDPGPGTVRVLHPDGSPYDAPERATRAGQVAAGYARALVPVGSVLLVVSFHLDAFGRTLGAVTLPDGRDWATVMTAAGHVKPAA
jgi:endonuclease YncB( thermonuclease family)